MLGKKKIKEEIVDTVQLARNKYPGSGSSLDALCKKYNIDNTKREKHNALLDCELLSKVYINLLDQKEPKFDLDIEKINNQKSLDNTTINYHKEVIRPSNEEIQLHKKFLKSEIKKNYFN